MAAARKATKSYLLAWDPVRQKEAWRAPNPGIVNGGVLSTGGGLVFQGDGDGRFNAYSATDGRKLWSFDARDSIMAAPVTYLANGRQLVSVVVGFGGAVALVGGELVWDRQGPRRNLSRVLTFALDGRATLPVRSAPTRIPVAVVPAVGDAAMIEAGRRLYLNTCAVCHGAGAKSGGVLPDLRRSAALRDRAMFHAIVGEGILSERGMAGFSANYDPGKIETLRAYLAKRAREDAGQW
ncbi:c-type cytochrome [Novosphingobium sp. Gsoil 351]|uniref:c-type cytochrome n=1 Tax=Novosphingobium sp. Gsoil 351 TaxID=2675225 RepID=UPI001E652B2F|nr:cytochrome c [Novosphingobium sp. Gsoil 351]